MIAILVLLSLELPVPGSGLGGGRGNHGTHHLGEHGWIGGHFLEDGEHLLHFVVLGVNELIWVREGVLAESL